MNVWENVLPYLNPDENKPLVIKPALAQLDYYQTHDRAGNKIHCDPIMIDGHNVGGFARSRNLTSGVLVDRIHPVRKECFDLLTWAADNSGGGVQVIFKTTQ